MRQWSILALALMVAPVARAQVGSGEAARSDEDRAARALAVYEQGKRLYDAKDYAGALERFDEAAAIEPGKARWQYNRGLALRKLNRFEEARDALLHARRLDPAYKRAEIDDKLREMGYSAEEEAPASPAPSEGSPPPDSGTPEGTGSSAADSVFFRIGQGLGFLLFCGTPLGLIVGIVLLIRRALRKNAPAASTPAASRAPARGPTPPVKDAELAPLAPRLERISSALVQVEHALRLEEDADLRAMLNQATMAEQRAREEVDRARRGQAALASVQDLVRVAEEGATAALKRARAHFGEQAFAAEGEKVGCYFCARPLANPTYRMQVPLKRGEDVTNVLACPPCANMAAAGQPPPVKVRVMGDGRMQHWSELNGYDPYTHRHTPFPGTSQVQAWKYAPERSLAEVAAMAAGGVLAGGLAAYGVSRLLDLDGAREAAAAQAATQAAAMRASERREERDWRDHS